MSADGLSLDRHEFLPPRWLRSAHLQSTLPTTALWRAPVWWRSARLRAQSTPVTLVGSGAAEGAEPVKLLGFRSRQTNANAPWVVVLHGWLGDAHSSYVLSLSAALYAQGYQVLRLNLRDHGGTEHLNPGIFHSCRLDDVVTVLKAWWAEELASAQRGSIDTTPAGFSLAGFSLGGNFALRVAAVAEQALLPINSVAAICPALHPHSSDAALVSGLRLYHDYFMLKWKQSLRRKQQLFPHLYDLTGWIEHHNLTTLTDELVRRHAGFSGVRAYYDGYSLLGPVLATVRASCHLLLAEDDPIVPVSDVSQLAPNPALHITRTRYGGHCGYVTGLVQPRWSDAWALRALADSASPSVP